MSPAQGHLLYYFKSWEDFGAGGVKAAINAADPIDVRKHEPLVVREENGVAVANRFDLVPTADPLGRKWQLQASNSNEASEWLMALDAARAVDMSPRAHAGAAVVVPTMGP